MMAARHTITIKICRRGPTSGYVIVLRGGHEIGRTPVLIGAWESIARGIADQMRAEHPGSPQEHIGFSLTPTRGSETK